MAYCVGDDLMLVEKRIRAVRRRIGYSINIANTSLKSARAYAEEEFEKAGEDLDEVLPNFDKNYTLLRKRLKGALNIPRIQMPVIEPSDMALFNKRLNQGSVDIFKPYAKGYLHMPKSLGGEEAEEWIELGFSDGSKEDDTVRGKITGTSVGKMKPTQSQIWFDKIIQLILKYGPATGGSPILSQTVIMSGDDYILDGHHRYAQAMISNPGLKMKTLVIPLPIGLLLKVGKTYGEAIGNKPKASINPKIGTEMDNQRIARELVSLAKSLTAGIPIKLHVGDKIEGADGTVVIIKDIMVNSFHLRPTTMVRYSYRTPEGRTGTEANSVETLREILEA